MKLLSWFIWRQWIILTFQFLTTSNNHLKDNILKYSKVSHPIFWQFSQKSKWSTAINYQSLLFLEEIQDYSIAEDKRFLLILSHLLLLLIYSTMNLSLSHNWNHFWGLVHSLIYCQLNSQWRISLDESKLINI